MLGLVVQPRCSWLVGLVVGLVAVVGLALWVSRPDGVGARAVSTESPRAGWQRLAYHDVQVDVPRGWSIQDSDHCPGDVEHWGPHTTAVCGDRPGVGFLDPGLFDAGVEPGTVVSIEAAGAPFWSGYVIVGDVVVSVADGDRGVVTEVLESAVAPGFRPIGQR